MPVQQPLHVSWHVDQNLVRSFWAWLSDASHCEAFTKRSAIQAERSMAGVLSTSYKALVGPRKYCQPVGKEDRPSSQCSTVPLQRQERNTAENAKRGEHILAAGLKHSFSRSPKPQTARTICALSSAAERCVRQVLRSVHHCRGLRIHVAASRAKRANFQSLIVNSPAECLSLPAAGLDMS